MPNGPPPEASADGARPPGAPHGPRPGGPAVPKAAHEAKDLPPSDSKGEKSEPAGADKKPSGVPPFLADLPEETRRDLLELSMKYGDFTAPRVQVEVRQGRTSHDLMLD
jgi:hypothetical protein